MNTRVVIGQKIPNWLDGINHTLFDFLETVPIQAAPGIVVIHRGDLWFLPHPQNKSISEWLGQEADALLSYEAKVPRSSLHLPGPDWVDRGFLPRAIATPRCSVACSSSTAAGGLANTGYLSILPVESGPLSILPVHLFAPNPIYFDPQNIIELAIAGGCNAVATTLGVLGSVISVGYAHKMPFIVKLNHNELLRLPQPLRSDHVCFGKEAGLEPGSRCRRGHPFTLALKNLPARFKKCGMPLNAPMSWAWPRFSGAICAIVHSRQDQDYHLAADLTGQANPHGGYHTGRHHQAKTAQIQQWLWCGGGSDGTGDSFGQNPQQGVFRPDQ